MDLDAEKHSQPNIRSGGSLLWIIAGFALVLRLVHLFMVKGTDLVQIPIIDAVFYHNWAVQISQGYLIGDQTFFMSPLFPYFTGLLYSIFGVKPVLVMLVQGLLGVCTVLLIYRFGARIAGRTVGLISAGLAAVYAPFIFYETTLLTSTIIVILSVVILNLSENVLKCEKRWLLMLSGLMIGLSALARPLVLIFLPLLFILFIIDNKTNWLRKSALVAAGVLILLIPVGVRNLIIGGEFTLTTSSAGMNFFVGNNPDATGLYWEAPFLTSFEPQYENEDYRRLASEAVGRNLNTSEAGQYWFGQALDWIIREPFSYLKLLVAKFYYFWNRAEFANNISIYYSKDVSPIVKYNPFGFWLIAPLGLGGLILLIRRKGWEKSGIAIAWVLAYFTGCLLFFVASEYRLPVAPVFLVAAAYLVKEIVREFKARRAEPAMRLIALGLILMPFTNFRTDFIHRGENARMDYFNYGNTLLKQQRDKEAITRFERSLEIDPYFPEGMMKLAEAYYRAGMTEKAVKIGERVGLKNPEQILEIVQGLALQEAMALLEEGKFKSALDEFSFAGLDPEEAAAETTRISQLKQAETALREGNIDDAMGFYYKIKEKDRVPDLIVLHNIAALYLRQGMLDSAEHYAAEVLSLDSMNVPTAHLMSRILNTTGRWEEAKRLIMRVNPNGPGMEDKLNAVRVVMDSLTELEQWEKALDAYGDFGREYFEIHPEDKLRIGRLQLEVGNLELALRLLTEAEASDVTEPELYYHQARAFQKLGRIAEAVAAVQKGVAKTPDFIEARILLARLYTDEGKIKEAYNELDAISHLEIVDLKVAEEYNSLLDSLNSL